MDIVGVRIQRVAIIIEGRANTIVIMVHDPAANLSLQRPIHAVVSTIALKCAVARKRNFIFVYAA